MIHENDFDFRKILSLKAENGIAYPDFRYSLRR